MVLKDIAAIASKINHPAIATLGSHSALDISEGAKMEDLQTIVVCQKGRDTTYTKYYRTRRRGKRIVGCIDEILMVDKFSEVCERKNLNFLNSRQAVFVPHRSFSVYVGYEKIENEFSVPILGNRYLLKAEERNEPKNQQYLLKKAGVRVPMTFEASDAIDRLVIVKASEAKRSYERAFFFAASPSQYKQKGAELVKKGVITQEGLEKALIEEVVLGAHYNFNYFYSPLHDEMELIGTDMRRQTNLDGILRLPASEQMAVLDSIRVSNVEVGHIACTVRESLLEAGLDAGEKLLATCKEEYAPGIIGPFALQGALAPGEKGEEFIVFDVSFRQPGSPGVRFTPYTGYLFGKQVSMGQRIAIEVRKAAKEGVVEKIIT